MPRGPCAVCKLSQGTCSALCAIICWRLLCCLPKLSRHSLSPLGSAQTPMRIMPLLLPGHLRPTGLVLFDTAMHVLSSLIACTVGVLLLLPRCLSCQAQLHTCWRRLVMSVSSVCRSASERLSFSAASIKSVRRFKICSTCHSSVQHTRHTTVSSSYSVLVAAMQLLPLHAWIAHASRAMRDACKAACSMHSFFLLLLLPCPVFCLNLGCLLPSSRLLCACSC